MPSQINRVPPGLLSLMDIKALGRNPDLLLDEVRPVFELREFYTRIYTQSEGTALLAVATPGAHAFTGITAGPGEVVLVSGLCVFTSAALAALTEIRFRAAVILNSTPAVPITICGDLAEGVAADIPVSGNNDLVVIPPGHSLGFVVERIRLGTAPDMTVWARTRRVAV
jgi:hypothetical protein